MWEKKNGTCTAVRLIEGVRLIWGPLNTGLTVREREQHVQTMSFLFDSFRLVLLCLFSIFHLAFVVFRLRFIGLCICRCISTCII